MQGCVDLIKHVLTVPPDTKGNRDRFQMMKVKNLLKAKDGKCKADAFQIADIVGNQEVIQTLHDLAREVNARYAGRASTKLSSHGSVDSSKNQTSGVSHIPIDSAESTHNFKEVRRCKEDEITKLLEDLPRSELLEHLEKQMNEDVDYNFENERKGLIFNLACKMAYTNEVFIRSVAEKARVKFLLQDLFNLQDAQGRTPLHVAIDNYFGEEDIKSIQLLLELIPSEWVNGVDGAGRTLLHRATANGMSIESSKAVNVLADHDRTNLSAEWGKDSGFTALHLAVLHCHGISAKYLLNAPLRANEAHKVNVEKQMNRPVKVYNNYFKYLDSKWTPLELAAVIGRYSVLMELLKSSSQHGRSRWDKRYLHLAAAAGEPRVIQALLMNRFDDL